MPIQIEPGSILTVNGGSSSLKFALFENRPPHSPKPTLRGQVDGIGRTGSHISIKTEDGKTLDDSHVDFGSSGIDAAAHWLLDWLAKNADKSAIATVAQRVVHGGPKYHEPEPVSDALLTELRELTVLDPDHLPAEIRLIELFRQAFPDAAQFACFDTAFHHDMPRVAQIIPIPRHFESLGIRRYGFHGLSYAYLVEQLAATVSPQAAAGRLVLAHLGSGASMAAVRGGRSLDTTMGLTPTSGLVMSTRTGDIDPSLPYLLARRAAVSPDAFHEMVNHQSGLKGISETTPDFRLLQKAETTDPRAAEALAVFVYHAQKAIGALAAVLGGIDTLVFTGGIGQNSPLARHRICTGLAFLGIVLDPDRNHAGNPLISVENAQVAVRVIPTDEESMMARSAARLLAPT